MIVPRYIIAGIFLVRPGLVPWMNFRPRKRALAKVGTTGRPWIDVREWHPAPNAPSTGWVVTFYSCVLPLTPAGRCECGGYARHVHYQHPDRGSALSAARQDLHRLCSGKSRFGGPHDACIGGGYYKIIDPA